MPNCHQDNKPNIVHDFIVNNDKKIRNELLEHNGRPTQRFFTSDELYQIIAMLEQYISCPEATPQKKGRIQIRANVWQLSPKQIKEWIRILNTQIGFLCWHQRRRERIVKNAHYDSIQWNTG